MAMQILDRMVIANSSAVKQSPKLTRIPSGKIPKRFFYLNTDVWFRQNGEALTEWL
jgi:hypothetical protein